MTQQNPPRRPHDVDASGEPEQVQALVADTNQTRDQMSGTLGEIGERLDPQRMVEQAKHTVREQTVGRVEGAVESAQTTTKDASRSAMETIKQNPVAAAVSGVGLVWLWTHRSGGQSGGSQQSGSAAQQAKQSAGQLQRSAGDTLHHGQQSASQAADKLQHVTKDAMQQGQHTAQQARSQVKRLHEQNPLAMGAVAFGAGAAVGMLLPETPPEKQFLGPPAQQVTKQAEKAVDQAKDQAEAVAESAKQAAKEEAKSQGLSS